MVSSYLSLVAATLASTVSAIATSGDFNVLAFNVAGLPAILNGNEVPGDKATNAGTIGTLFAKYDYDMIHVQEGTLLETFHVTTVSLIGISRFQLSCLHLCH